MAKRPSLLICFITAIFASGVPRCVAQQPEEQSNIRVSVVLVQLNVAVTDNKGNYVSGLKPEDFVITEDKIPEKLSTFQEGNEPTRTLINGVEIAPFDCQYYSNFGSSFGR